MAAAMLAGAIGKKHYAKITKKVAKAGFFA